MNDQEYYFERDAESLAVGEMIDGLKRFNREVFRKLHVDGESHEEISEDLKCNPEIIEEIEDAVFQALKPAVSLLMNKDFEEDDVLNDVERDFVADIFRKEIHFREDRANFIKTRRLLHVPA